MIMTYFAPSFSKFFNKSYFYLLGHRPTSETETGTHRINTRHWVGYEPLEGVDILDPTGYDRRASRNKMTTETTDLHTTVVHTSQQLSSFSSRWRAWDPPDMLADEVDFIWTDANTQRNAYWRAADSANLKHKVTESCVWVLEARTIMFLFRYS
jgi:hypothetical protein